MYCSLCGHENGAFAVRCRTCGAWLARRAGAGLPVIRTGDRPWPALAIVGAALGMISTVALIALAAMITRQDLWPRLLESAGAETPVVVTRAPLVNAAGLTAVPPLSPTPAFPGMLGQINASGAWRVVVDRVDAAPDETSNGWMQVGVTCTFENQGDVAASLPIPSTVVKPDPTRSTPA